MESDDPDDWYRAWRDYLEPLNRKYPDHPYQEQVEQYRQRMEKAAKKARAPTLKEWEQWYYTREDIPESVREFIAQEVLQIEYKSLAEIKKERAAEEAAKAKE
jgi:hypothetical protein